uniref:Uncharacterized protein n=1 Tax=Noccaea caerulescens TaxID=107243 RepID=A0A1J3JS30_NOCCA
MKDVKTPVNSKIPKTYSSRIVIVYIRISKAKSGSKSNQNPREKWWEVELHREEVQLQLQACVGGSRAAPLEEEHQVVQQDPCFSSTLMKHPVSRSPQTLSLS